MVLNRLVQSARYGRYLFFHKLHVYRAGRVLGVSRKRLLLHDMSKFSRTEWKPYLDWFYGNDQSNPAAYEAAWHSHVRNNDHHYQHWYDPETGTSLGGRAVRQEGGNQYSDMFSCYPAFCEMVADWASVAKTLAVLKDGHYCWVPGNWSPRKWLKEHGEVLATFTVKHQLEIWYLVSEIERAQEEGRLP